MAFDIYDIQFLLSALIQVLPTILSISLLGFTALSPERGYYKRFSKPIFIIILIVLYSLLMDIIVLSSLKEFLENNSFLVSFSLVLSLISIGILFSFIGYFIREVSKDSKKKKPSDECIKPVDILKMRYVMGDLSQKEYKEMLKKI